jgi:hypothetical protein
MRKDETSTAQVLMLTMKHPIPSTGLGKLLGIDSHGLAISNTEGITWLMVPFPTTYLHL